MTSASSRRATHLARVAIERDRAEVALRNSEEKYRDLINASPDAICVTDVDSKVVLLNPAGVELFGRPEEELIGSLVTETYVPEELESREGTNRKIESGRVVAIRAKIRAQKWRSDSGRSFCFVAARAIFPSRN